MKNDSSSANKHANIAISNEINAKVTHYKNIDQSFITSTEDKIKLILLKYLSKIEDKKSWIAPLGIFITLLLIPLTTEKFKDAFSIPASVWQAACYIAIIISCCWLVKAIYKSRLSRNVTLDSIIDELKQNTKTSGKNN